MSFGKFDGLPIAEALCKNWLSKQVQINIFQMSANEFTEEQG